MKIQSITGIRYPALSYNKKQLKTSEQLSINSSSNELKDYTHNFVSINFKLIYTIEDLYS